MSCPADLIDPFSCRACIFGHPDVCHFPFNCDDVSCDLGPPPGIFALEDPNDPEVAARIRRAEELDRAAGYPHWDCRGRPHCRVCGCCDLHPCDGGCIWAAPNLCSRCAR